MEADGFGGDLYVGHALAARLGRWRLRPALTGWIVTADFAWRNSYWITQRPLRLELHIGGLSWTWTDVQLDEGGGVINVPGPPEEGVVVAQPIRIA